LAPPRPAASLRSAGRGRAKYSNGQLLTRVDSYFRDKISAPRRPMFSNSPDQPPRRQDERAVMMAQSAAAGTTPAVLTEKARRALSVDILSPAAATGWNCVGALEASALAAAATGSPPISSPTGSGPAPPAPLPLFFQASGDQRTAVQRRASTSINQPRRASTHTSEDSTHPLHDRPCPAVHSILSGSTAERGRSGRRVKIRFLEARTVVHLTCGGVDNRWAACDAPRRQHNGASLPWRPTWDWWYSR